MGSIWTIELFGGLRASQGDRTLTRFEMRRVASLLAYLAYFPGREHSRETLIEMLWPETDPEAGRNRFSVVLSSLRRDLEPPGVAAGSVLFADRVAVRLNPDAVVTDVREFTLAIEAASRTEPGAERAEHLARAGQLYQGPLLPGFYGRWIGGEQARLADRFFAALTELVKLTEEAGDPARAVEYARQAVRVDPLREEAHRELMRLYAGTGQDPVALRHYKDLERLLDRE